MSTGPFRRLADSGALFLIVAILCFIAGMTAGNGTVFLSLGAFWVIMAVIVRSRNKGKPPGE